MAKTLIKTSGAISAGTCDVTFINGASDVVLDDTYDVYEFHFYNIHPDTNATILSFQVDVSSGTTYGQSITSNTFEAEHDEAGSGYALQYRTGRDQGNGTEYQQLSEYIYNGVGDESASGILTLFAPSSGTYIKHWMSVVNAYGNATTQVSYHGGYINQTSAIDRIRFAMTANDPATLQDDITSGTIKMYGLATS